MAYTVISFNFDIKVQDTKMNIKIGGKFIDTISGIVT